MEGKLLEVSEPTAFSTSATSIPDPCNRLQASVKDGGQSLENAVSLEAFGQRPPGYELDDDVGAKFG